MSSINFRAQFKSVLLGGAKNKVRELIIVLMKNFEKVGAVMCIQTCFSMIVYSDMEMEPLELYRKLISQYIEFVEILRQELIKHHFQNFLGRVDLNLPNLSPLIEEHGKLVPLQNFKKDITFSCQTF